MEALANKFRKTKGATVSDRLEIEKAEIGKIDGRSLRRTGRTEQFAARIKPETKAATEDQPKRGGLRFRFADRVTKSCNRPASITESHRQESNS